jgi:hypothetical protein
LRSPTVLLSLSGAIALPPNFGAECSPTWQIDITTDPETNQQAWSTTLRLADSYRLTLYDAAYLELAQRRQLPFASLDTALTAAAKAAGTTVLP